MAKLAGYGGTTLLRWGRQIVLALADANGVVSTTISANGTFDNTSAMVSLVNGGAADRTLTADASCEIAGMIKVFKNTGTTNLITIKKSDATNIAPLSPGDWVVCVHNGTTWVAMGNQALSSILATSNTWSALQTFSAGIAPTTVAATGVITSTGGVAGGTAAKMLGTLHVKQGTTTVTNTTTETDLGTHTLEPSTIGLGKAIEITCTARITGITGTPNLNLKLYCGSTVLAQTTSVAVLANDYYQLTFRLVGQAAASASSAVSNNGTITAKISGTVATTVSTASPTNMATNGTLTIKLTATWSVANASNIVICDDFMVKAN